MCWGGGLDHPKPRPNVFLPRTMTSSMRPATITSTIVAVGQPPFSRHGDPPPQLNPRPTPGTSVTASLLPPTPRWTRGRERASLTRRSSLTGEQQSGSVYPRGRRRGGLAPRPKPPLPSASSSSSSRPRRHRHRRRLTVIISPSPSSSSSSASHRHLAVAVVVTSSASSSRPRRRRHRHQHRRLTVTVIVIVVWLPSPPVVVVNPPPLLSQVPGRKSRSYGHPPAPGARGAVLRLRRRCAVDSRRGVFTAPPDFEAPCVNERARTDGKAVSYDT